MHGSTAVRLLHVWYHAWPAEWHVRSSVGLSRSPCIRINIARLDLKMVVMENPALEVLQACLLTFMHRIPSMRRR